MRTEDKTDPPPLDWAEALGRVMAEASPVGTEVVSLAHSAGLVAAESLRSPIPVPPFDSSAMDGFAVRSADLAQASPDTPAFLRVVGMSSAGSPFDGEVGPGEAVEIMTGAPFPGGADAVAPVETTLRRDSRTVGVLSSVSRGSSVRRMGADSAGGSVLVQEGDRIGSGNIGLLASAGIGSLRVYRRPRIAVLTSGNELVEAGSREPLRPGMIFDANTPMLMARLREHGFQPEFLGILRDDPSEIRASIERGLTCDFVVTTGGVSMGRFDLVRPVLESLGLRRIFWRVNQQPGGPVLFSRTDSCLVFGLPGNPVSAFVCADLLLAPALRRASGMKTCLPPRYRVRTGESLAKPHGKTVFLRAVLRRDTNGTLFAWRSGPQDSNIIRSVAAHDGYLVFPAGLREMGAGAMADFLVANPDTVTRACADDSEVFPTP